MDLKGALKTSEKELNKHVNAEIAAKKEEIAKKVDEELKDVSRIDENETGTEVGIESILRPHTTNIRITTISGTSQTAGSEGIQFVKAQSQQLSIVISGLGLWLIFSLLVTICIYVANLFRKVERPFKTAFKKSCSYYFVIFMVIAVVFYLFYYCFRELDLGSLGFSGFFGSIF